MKPSAPRAPAASRTEKNKNKFRLGPPFGTAYRDGGYSPQNRKRKRIQNCLDISTKFLIFLVGGVGLVYPHRVWRPYVTRIRYWVFSRAARIVF
jgi:hypothetical protein